MSVKVSEYFPWIKSRVPSQDLPEINTYNDNKDDRYTDRYQERSEGGDDHTKMGRNNM